MLHAGDKRVWHAPKTQLCLVTRNPFLPAKEHDLCICGLHMQIHIILKHHSHLVAVRSCRFAVLSGDPMQLPPLIAHPAQLAQQPGAGPAHGLLRPVFVRLASMGHHVHLLRRQYRLPFTHSTCLSCALQLCGLLVSVYVTATFESNPWKNSPFELRTVLL